MESHNYDDCSNFAAIILLQRINTTSAVWCSKVPNLINPLVPEVNLVFLLIRRILQVSLNNFSTLRLIVASIGIPSMSICKRRI